MTIEKLPYFCARAVSLALISSTLCPAQPAPKPEAGAVIAKFVGKWKENEAKRKIGSTPGLRFRKAADGGLEELRGPEARPLVQPVKFDGKPYTVDNSKNTLVWKQIDARHFERTIAEGGKLIATRKIELSADGKTLTEVTGRKVPAGKDLVATIVYRRSSGDAQGLVGVWKIESIRSSEPAEITYEAMGTNGLRFTNRLGMIQVLTFDGKANPVTGPAVISGTTSAAKISGPNTIETTASREGVATGKATMVVSNDGKTLTTTSVSLGPNAGSEPGVTVFEKQ